MDSGPEDGEEDDLGRLVALQSMKSDRRSTPEGADEEVEGRVVVLAGEGVGGEGREGDEFGGGYWLVVVVGG